MKHWLFAGALLAGAATAAPVMVPSGFDVVPEGVTMQRYDGAAAEWLSEPGQLVLTTVPLSDAVINALPVRPVRVLVAANWPLRPADAPPARAFGDDGAAVWYGYAVVADTAQGTAISAQLDQLASAMSGEWVAPPAEVVQSNRVSLGVALPRLRGGYR